MREALEPEREEPFVAGLAVHLDKAIPQPAHRLPRVEVARRLHDDPAVALVDPVLQELDEHLLLALEVRIERPAREAGLRGYLLDAGALEPALDEDVRRRIQQ